MNTQTSLPNAQSPIPKAYTDSPDLHPNLLIASFQALFWLFFHPSAWRNYIARIDPELRPAFWPVELKASHWCHPQLQRLLVIAFGVWPLLAGLLVGSVVWLMGRASEDVAPGVVFGAVSYMAGGVAFSMGLNGIAVVFFVLPYLLYNVARAMVESAQRQRGFALPALPREAMTTDPFTVFDEWLDQVEHTLGDHTALLMLDEFEALDNAMNRGRYDEEDILGLLRHLIQHRTRFKVLLAGSHTLMEYQRWASYLINVQTVSISYLKEDEARQLIERPVKDFTLHYEANASQRIIDLTRCHPFLVQLLCSELVALKNEQDPSVRRLATLADVEAAVPEALAHGSMFFADLEHNQVNEAGRAVLRTLAVCGEGGIMERERLAQVCPAPIDETLKLLQQRELIESVESGYRFQVELIRRWFAQ